MKIIKRHKGLAVVLGLTLILAITMFAICSRMFFSSSNSNYGDRLNGIAKIDKSDTEKLISELEEKEEVSSVDVRTQGKIIYITIIYGDSVSKETAKNIANDTYKYYSEEVIDDYDFGYFLKQEKETSDDNEDTSFIVIGTKHPDNDKISWTKN